jgi:hypothetical protein
MISGFQPVSKRVDTNSPAAMLQRLTDKTTAVSPSFFKLNGALSNLKFEAFKPLIIPILPIWGDAISPDLVVLMSSIFYRSKL